MVAGQERTYRKRQAGMRAVFTLYPYYDKIVACGKAIMKVNRQNLATAETYAKFTYATNTIDFQRVKDGLKQEPDIIINGAAYLLRPQAQDGGEIILADLIKLPSPHTINFVTIGRLSPEKNHANLITAFAKLYADNPDCRLYIIGEGDLRPHLEKQISKLELQEAVFLVGNLSNPFLFMKACHCFVFPSYYEGQGLVVLEARLVGLPILLADFAAAGDVLVENGQLVIKQDVESIYQGLRAFLKGQVPGNYHFDPDAYNQKCYREFEALFTDS
jgi:glycosyltransferase involved in cell wall biosynthesis